MHCEREWLQRLTTLTTKLGSLIPQNIDCFLSTILSADAVSRTSQPSHLLFLSRDISRLPKASVENRRNFANLKVNQLSTHVAFSVFAGDASQ